MYEVRKQNDVYIQSDKALHYKIVTFGRIQNSSQITFQLKGFKNKNPFKQSKLPNLCFRCETLHLIFKIISPPMKVHYLEVKFG